MGSKKAVFFSLIAILMSTLFIVLFSTSTHVSLDRYAEIANYDVDYMNDFVSDVDIFVDYALEIAAFYTLNDLSYQAPVDDAYVAFEECFSTGMFVSGASSVPCSVSDNHSFPAVLDDLLTKAKLVHEIDLDISLLSVSMLDNSYFDVGVDAIVRINISRFDASWIRTVNSSKFVSYTGIVDPLSVGTSYERVVKLHPTIAFADTFAVGSFSHNYDVFEEFVSNEYYFADQSAPSFVDRLEGRVPANVSGDYFSAFGIASFVQDDYDFDPPRKSSFVLWHNKVPSLTFIDDDLRRINHTGINTNFMVPVDFILINMNSGNSSCSSGFGEEILNVTSCCHPVLGCTPECGFTSC